MSVTAERLMVEVRADVRDALAKLTAVEAKSASTGARIGKMAKGLGLAFTGAALVGGLKKTITLAADFDQTMRQVGIQTGKTGQGLEKLGKLALKMGADTVFSAQDASGAMLELSKGGLSAADIKAGALDQTLRLAAAGGVELGQAAGYIVQGMNTYGLKAKDAVRVTTALAGGADASTASVDSLGQALSQVGPGAVNAGMSIEETVAALAAFDNAGIKGSDAGTSLKTMLTSLVPATTKAKSAMTKYGLEFIKRNGDFKDMTKVAEELKDGLGDLSQAEKTAALRTIFGSDATRAASVLMKEGAKGVQKYVDATNDRAKAQEMADVSMEGAKGAIENFTGSLETAGIAIGRKLLPAFTEALNVGSDLVGDMMTWGPDIAESFGWTIDAGKLLLDVLKPIAGVVQAGASAFNGLPGPVKETATQLALAALVFPRLAAAATSAGASVTGSLSRMGAKARQYGAEMTYAETRTARLGQAAKTAAGIGGMMLLAKSAGETDGAMKTLGSTAGGALLGFSVGGPWGAAIGAAIGGLSSLSGQVDGNVMSMEEAKGAAVDYASSLDQITGAAGRATRAVVAKGLQEDGVLDSTRSLGIATRDMVGAILGQEGAQKRVNAATKGAERELMKLGRQGKLTDGVYQEMVGSITQVRGFVDGMGRDFRKAARDTREVGQATQTWKQALSSLPKKVQTELKQEGYRQSYGQLRKLVDTYKVTPKQVRTMVEALGVDLTKGQLKDLIREAKTLDDMKPRPRVDADTKPADSKLNSTQRLLQELGRGKANPSASLNDQASGPIGAVGRALSALDGRSATVTTTYRTIRETVNKVTGSSLFGFASGGYTGPGGKYDVAGAVHRGEYVMDAETTDRARPLLEAIHAAKGKVYGYADGGMAGSRPGAKKPVYGADTVRGIVQAIRQGNKETKKTFRGLENVIRRNMDGEREKAWMKRLNKTQDRLTKVQERSVQATKKLTNAQEKLANVRQAKSSFIETARAGMASQATVLNAGNSASAIQASLAVQVEKVKSFAAMLGKLRKMGYGPAIVQQVAEAGVEGGYAAAEALLQASSPEQVRQITASFNAITKTAKESSTKLGGQLFDAGVKSAQGLVKGLKSQKKAIQDTMLDIAMSMQKALKKALGIKSPSRVMTKLGTFTGRGLVVGLEGQEKAVRGAALGLGRASILGAEMGSTRGLSVASLQGGQRAGSSISFSFTTINPQAEPQSRTTNRALSKVASLSLV